jgi:hypothetical protein
LKLKSAIGAGSNPRPLGFDGHIIEQSIEKSTRILFNVL